jgi:nitrate reductase NapE component
MTETNSGDQGHQKNGSQTNPKWWTKPKWWAIAIWTVFSGASVGGLWYLIWICQTYFTPPKDTELGVPAVVAYVALIAVIAQVAVNVLQWQQTRELFDLAERPSLGVELESITVAKDDTATVRVILRNSGRSPARQVSVVNNLNFHPPDIPKDVCPEPTTDDHAEPLGSKVVIPVNGMAHSISETIPADRIQQVFSDQQLMFIWVRVTYKGLRGSNYFVEYYARYSNKVGGFQGCQNHNDAD